MPTNIYIISHHFRLTEDISVFASSIAHLYSSVTKPCFDLMLIGLALMRSSRKMKSNIFTGILYINHSYKI